MPAERRRRGVPGDRREAVALELSTLCQSCGLCCDGTLFAWVPLTDEEADRLMDDPRVELFRHQNGSLVLAQPCGALKGATCTVYKDRPSRCREFICLLYSAVAEKEVDLYDALEVVDGAHEAVSDVAVAFGIDSTAVRSVLPEARRRVANDPDVTDAQRAALSKAEKLLDRHFRGRKKRG